MKRINQRRNGVALLEVLMAVLVFSLGCLAIAKAMENIFGTESMVLDQERMARLVDHEMKLLLANPTNPTESASREEIINGVDYVISHTAEPRVLKREEHPDLQVYEIRVEVSADDLSESLVFWKAPNG